MKPMRRLRPLDLPLGIILLGAALVPWLLPPEPGGTVVITAPAETIRLPLNEDRTVRVQGLLGETVIRIEDGTARVISSACHNKLCVRMGAVGLSGEAVACVPNGVSLVIEGEAEGGVDAVTR